MFQKVQEDHEVELMALFAEELGEALQAAGKVMRHGWQSSDPTKTNSPRNRTALESEIGHVLAVIEVMAAAGMFQREGLIAARDSKLHRLDPWLHVAQSRVAVSLARQRLHTLERASAAWSQFSEPNNRQVEPDDMVAEVVRRLRAMGAAQRSHIRRLDW